MNKNVNNKVEQDRGKGATLLHPPLNVDGSLFVERESHVGPDAGKEVGYSVPHPLGDPDMVEEAKNEPMQDAVVGLSEIKEQVDT